MKQQIGLSPTRTFFLGYLSIASYVSHSAFTTGYKLELQTPSIDKIKNTRTWFCFWPLFFFFPRDFVLEDMKTRLRAVGL